MSSRRRFAGHARPKRSTDAKKVEHGPFLPPPAPPPPSGPVVPDAPTPAPLPPTPEPIPGNGDSSNDGGGNGNGGGSSSGGSGGPSGASSTGSSGTSNGGSSVGPTSISPQAEPTSETDANKSTSISTSTATSTSLTLGLANVGSNPSSPSSPSPVTLSANFAVTSISSSGVPVATFSSGAATDTGNLDGGDNSTTDEDTGTTISQSHNLSAGAIGGIVTALFIVGLATLIVVLRRRAIARRVKRRELWFAREGLGTGNSASGGGMTRSRSARSSFGTTFDQSQSPLPNMNFAARLPPMPLMAETRGEGPFVLNLDSSSLASENSRRNSAGSSSSTASDPNAQFLYIPQNTQGYGTIGSPMSVRPFSPTESYSFPRPPSDTNANRGSVSSCSQSNGVSEPEDSIQTSTATSPTVPLSGADANPFADPMPAETVIQPAFAEIQVIRRPFIPRLQDGLNVAVGDSVGIVQRFDDGWAMVQKIPPLADKKGKARAVDESDQGLIPVDCLREADLPEFVAQYSDVNPSSVL